MGDNRPNLKLSREDGEVTRRALKRYRDGHNLDSVGEAIQDLLPDWTFQPEISPDVGVMFEESRHHSITTPESSKSIQNKVHSEGSHSTFLGSSPGSWDKKIGYAEGVIREMKTGHPQYELTELSVYDIGPTQEFMDEFGQDSGIDIDRIEEYCKKSAELIEDTAVSGMAGLAILAKALEEAGSERIVLLLPKESPITAVSDSSVPSTLHFQEENNQT